MEVIREIALFLFYIIAVFFLLQLLIPVVFFVIHWMLTKDPKKILNRYPIVSNKQFDFAAIVTAHQDSRFILPLVDSLLKQNYANYTIYVVADDCQDFHYDFSNPSVVLLKPAVALNAKIKSIKFAMDHFIRQHDALIIFDSDNLAHPSFLKNLNEYFQRGFKAVQANMLSKNLDTAFSKVDGMGHTYHNFMERQIKMEMGTTSAILGLGIAVDINLYRTIIYSNNLGGFDKRLQTELANQLPLVVYAKDVIVYDEKSADKGTFQKQRTRWIFTYFKYFKYSFRLFVNGIRKLHTGRLLLGFSMMRPPLFITLMVSGILTAIAFFINPVLGWIGIGTIVLFAINFVLVVITQSQQKDVTKALIYLPIVVWTQFKSLLKLKRANKSFLKTEHDKVIYIDELLPNAKAI